MKKFFLFLFILVVFSHNEIYALNAFDHKISDMEKANASELFHESFPEEPDENIRSVFLRKSSIILRKGKWEFESGFYYQREKYQLLDGRVEVDRIFYAPLSLRYGVFNFLETALSIPVAYGIRELTVEGSQLDYNEAGFGDTNFIIKSLLVQESNFIPEIVGSIHIRLPTGSHPYSGDGTKVGLGSGHLAVTGGVQFNKTSDPIVLFWGFDYTYEFEENYLGINIEPGETFGYNFGFGFAINPDIALNIWLSGKYETETYLDNNPLEGSSKEPILLRLGITNRWAPNIFFEPSVSFGLNSETTDSIIGFGLITRF